MSSRTVQPLSTRQFVLAGAAAVAAVLAHVQHLPLLITLFALTVVIANGWLLRRGAAAPPGWIKLALIIAFLLILLVEYRSIVGREPGSALACAMLTLKLFETRTRRDARALVSFSSFTLMVALLFDTSLLFTLTTFFGVVLLLAALYAVETESAGSGLSVWQVRSYWPAVRASLISLALALPLMVCGFLFIPRLDTPLWRTPNDTTMHSGLGDTMSPASVRDLLLDDSAAFRAHFDGSMPERQQLYWRGPVLTDFDGTTWRRRDTVFADSTSKVLTATSHAIGYEIVLEASGQPWLFALDQPLDYPADAMRGQDMSLIRHTPVTELYRYTMHSALDYRLDTALSGRQRRAALALPDGFNPRSVAQGRAWRNELHDDQAVVNAALQTFHNDFFYTLSPPPMGRDSIDDFLFDGHRGFCQHFASAFVVLMRAAGIPARVVTGYQGGFYNRAGNYLVVRQSDAHAWAEIWSDARGWQRVDPTAAVSPQRVELGAQSVGAEARAWFQGGWLLGLRNQFDLINRGWDMLVVQFNGQRQLSLLSPFGIDRIDSATLIWLLIFIGGVLVGAGTVWAMRTTRRQRAPVDVAYDALCRKVAKVAIRRRLNEGPRDYASRIRAAQALAPRDKDAVTRLLALFIDLRYANPLPAPAAVVDFRRQVRQLKLAVPG